MGIRRDVGVTPISADGNAHIYQDDDDRPYDQRDENYVSSEDETSSHYCEVCDREFFTAELLERHEETHTTCSIDGCTFNAHPKIVEKHISMQHCTGLYHRMKNLSTPEDIQKWIAERKKKYPTKSNIEHKKAEETEKKERGEIIEEKSSRSKLSDKPGREKKRKPRKRKAQDCKVEPEPETEFYRGLRPFAGTANLIQDTKNEPDVEVEPEKIPECIAARLSEVPCEISDEEEQEATPQCERIQKIEKPDDAKIESKSQSCLTSLVANYGSDSSDDEGPVEIPIKKIKADLPVEESSPQIPSPSVAESTDGKENDSREIDKVPSCSAKHTKSPSQRNDRPQDKSRRKIDENNADSGNNRRNRRRLMLLQRLLSRSMQHERNLICQCIKHIADHNFLQ